MKKLILIAFIALCSNFVKAQDLTSARRATVKAFLSAVFKEKKDTRFIVDNYLYQAANDSISQAKKDEFTSAMIVNLRNTIGKKLMLSDYELVNYDDFKGSKKRFNTDDYKDIMILTIKNEPPIYLSFKEERIASFTTINKGGLSFFVVI